MKNIKGVNPVLPIICDKDENINFNYMAELIDNLVSGGVSGITLFGFGSEFYKLSDKERMQLLKLFVDYVDKRVTTIINVTQHSTKNACEQAYEAQEAGADAVMILPPFLVEPDTDSVIFHIKSVINSIKMPAIIQYAPEDTKVDIPFEVFKKLNEEFPNRLLVKVESQLCGGLVPKLISENINVLTGDGGLNFYEGLEQGATGVMPGCSLYDVFVSIQNNYEADKKDIAFNLHNKILPFLLYIAQSAEMFVYAEKYFLNLRGLLKEDYGRNPKFTLDANQKGIIKKYFNDLKL